MVYYDNENKWPCYDTKKNYTTLLKIVRAYRYSQYKKKEIESVFEVERIIRQATSSYSFDNDDIPLLIAVQTVINQNNYDESKVAKITSYRPPKRPMKRTVKRRRVWRLKAKQHAAPAFK